MLLLPAPLFALTAYALHLSYHNILHLRKYEERSEKAAQYSTTAASRLSRTRKTQTASTLALILSALTALTLLVLPSAKSSRIAAALGNAAVLLAAREYMGRFWNDEVQVKVPFVEAFNEAVRGSERVVQLLGVLGGLWGIVGCVWGGGFGGRM